MFYNDPDEKMTKENHVASVTKFKLNAYEWAP
jgi:hypothetical protein